MNTDTISGLTVEVDYQKSLSAMIAAGKYDWVNPDITADRFPIETTTSTKKHRTKLFHFDRPIISEAAVAEMMNEHFTPATHVHGLAFGAAFPEEQHKYPIACLGSSARVGGHRGVVCLDRRGGQRFLDLYDWLDDWENIWRFLAVQEISDTQRWPVCP
jgi:hypothetical protein